MNHWVYVVMYVTYAGDNEQTKLIKAFTVEKRAQEYTDLLNQTPYIGQSLQQGNYRYYKLSLN